MRYEKALVWFRRDLRDHDHAALHAALNNARVVYCAFVFDHEILDALPSRADRRVEFILGSLHELDAALARRGGGLIVRQGLARDEIPTLAAALGVEAVFANHDYEPAAKARDAAVSERLHAEGRRFHGFKDQVIFSGDDVLTQAGTPFTVFTPYKNAWLKRLSDADIAHYDCTGGLHGQLAPRAENALPTLADLGFTPTNLTALGIRSGMSGAAGLWADFAGERLAHYGERRDFPALKGVSYLSVHLRFGTLSLRQLVREARAARADTWLSELIWRDFYFMILDHFPLVVTQAFKPAFADIRWETGPQADEHFAAWCEGRTGYPLVDAAMRQLRHSGWMHNRLRMVVASFLTKDLGIDWRRGEQFFADQLNDFDLAANNGGWQWAASTGCDAQPYFRIFNPVTQSQKFDPEGQFIRRYVPELAALSNKAIHAPWTVGRLPDNYPPPIVDHAQARESTLARYAVAR